MIVKRLAVPILAAVMMLGGTLLTAQSEDPDRTLDIDAEMVELTRMIPGFGGLFFDKKGRPNVHLADPASESRIKDMGPDVVIHHADFDFSRLQSYRVGLRMALSFEGVVALDVDERFNRVRVSIDQDLAAKEKVRLRNRILQLSADPEAVLIDEIPAFKREISVDFRVRPIPGGALIRTPSTLCTLGFNINGASEFVTTSTCTGIRGAVHSTIFSEGDPAEDIGVEIVDPPFNVQPCPFGRRCRRSDSARVRYNSTGIGHQGRIARTVTCNTGAATDLLVDGSLAIVSVGTAMIGQTVTKIGATTGCGRGEVVQTCTDINVSGENITLLCQSIVQSSGPPLFLLADGGSPVFIQEGDSAIAVGMAWVGNGSGSIMAFSPINQIIEELF